MMLCISRAKIDLSSISKYLHPEEDQSIMGKTLAEFSSTIKLVQETCVSYCHQSLSGDIFVLMYTKEYMYTCTMQLDLVVAIDTHTPLI